MRSQSPAQGVGRSAATRDAFAARQSTEGEEDQDRGDRVEAEPPSEPAAPNAIAANSNATVTATRTRCAVSASVSPPAARISRWCIAASGDAKPRAAGEQEPARYPQ